MEGLYISFSKTGEHIECDLALKSAVRAAVRATLLREGFDFECDLSVTFTDNEYIRKLNRKHRGVDKPTDVLSFPMYEAGELTDAECALGVTLGDIVISLERAAQQAEEVGNSFLREVSFLAVHSTLHLLGYDHERSTEDDEEQCRVQKEIMETIAMQ